MGSDLTGTAILTLIALLIPIIGALWRIFSIRETLASESAKLSHRLDLLELRETHVRDEQILVMNGIKELAQHARNRSAEQEKLLASRLLDIERFLEKSTEFSPRG